MKVVKKALLLQLLTDLDILAVVQDNNWEFTLTIKGAQNATQFEYVLLTDKAEVRFNIKDSALASSIAVALKYGQQIEIVNGSIQDEFNILGLTPTQIAMLAPRSYGTTVAQTHHQSRPRSRPVYRGKRASDEANDLTYALEA